MSGSSLLERVLLALLLSLLVPLRGALAELLEDPAHDAQEQHGHRDRDGLRHVGRDSPAPKERHTARHRRKAHR